MPPKSNQSCIQCCEQLCRAIRRGTGIGSLLGWTLIASAQSAAPGPAPDVTAHLQYREVNYSPLVWEIGVGSDVRFLKEPSWANANIFRGVFQLGNLTNQFIPFAWETKAGVLHLDLNRNLDLTDDPAGRFAGTGRDVHLFRSLRLEFGAGESAYAVRVDAHLFMQNGKPRAFLYVRSLWEGSVELGGRRYYLAVIDRPDGRIGPPESAREIADRMLLRPRAEREAPTLAPPMACRSPGASPRTSPAATAPAA